MPRCELCGTPVEVVSSPEGTSHYRPATDAGLEGVLGFDPKIRDETLAAIEAGIIEQTGNGELAAWFVLWVRDAPQRNQAVRDLFSRLRAERDAPVEKERHGWELEHGITVAVCPGCAFSFDAQHEETDGSGYSCPCCAEADNDAPVNSYPPII